MEINYHGARGSALLDHSSCFELYMYVQIISQIQKRPFPSLIWVFGLHPCQLNIRVLLNSTLSLWLWSTLPASWSIIKTLLIDHPIFFLLFFSAWTDKPSTLLEGAPLMYIWANKLEIHCISERYILPKRGDIGQCGMSRCYKALRKSCIPVPPDKRL